MIVNSHIADYTIFYIYVLVTFIYFNHCLFAGFMLPYLHYCKKVKENFVYYGIEKFFEMFCHILRFTIVLYIGKNLRLI